MCASYLCLFLSLSLSLLFCLTISLSETETHTRCVCVCVSYSLFLSLYNRYDFNVVKLECVSSSLFYLSVTTMQPNLIGRDILRERESVGCQKQRLFKGCLPSASYPKCQSPGILFQTKYIPPCWFHVEIYNHIFSLEIL